MEKVGIVASPFFTFLLCEGEAGWYDNKAVQAGH
jgi:hypothetical protein